jgi:hypothetical protein
MFRYVVPGAVCLFIAATPAFAQQSPNPPPPARIAPPASPSAQVPGIPPDSEETMEDAMAGDHWTYELRDEITGDVKSTSTYVVTEVADKTVSVRVSILGNPNPGYMTFDRSWNVINGGVWKYAPNDGTGVRPSLAVGKTWSFQSNDVNSTQGVTFKRSGTSKVVGQESITTRAGTFDAFKIQTSSSIRNANDPTRKFDSTTQMWYVPAINHWVKRVFTMRSDGQLRENSTMELVEFGRK